MTVSTAYSVDQLLKMSQAQLDDLFRQSETGEFGTGDSSGTAIVLPGTPFSGLLAKLGYWLIWQGKVISPDGKRLKNKLTPFRIKAIAANVDKDISRLDGKECTLLDYSKTSFVAGFVRDEVRQVGPNTFLGIVYCWKIKTINFVLVFPEK
ncbi:MAG TPA: hypothetical protein VH186_12510 [Chloroflexia bacterium]|nr:hypothetical protein [Chloroflexia bacterium]